MIAIIVAIARNGVIGNDNSLIWRISEDLRRFKALTTGHPVVMGRKTYESLGRPLPNRTNVVITRNPDYRAEGCTVVHSLEQALAMFPKEEPIFIIGGAEIYRQALPLADTFYLTEVGYDYDGDTVFTDWNDGSWRETSREHHPRGEKFEHPFTFINFEKCTK